MENLQLDFFMGVLAAVLLGNGLAVVFFYAIFWGDKQIRNGADETKLPLWFYFGGTVPPLIGAVGVYYSLY